MTSPTTPTPAVPPAPADQDEARERVGARPSWRAAGGWLVLAGIAIAIDGLVGGLTMVLIAAFVLAGLNTRWLGAIGTALLAAVPIVIIGRGLPAGEELSPAFVYESLVPHHLTFAGLILVCACALLDVRPHLADFRSAELPKTYDGPPLGAVLGAVVVAIIAIAAWYACTAVLSG